MSNPDRIDIERSLASEMSDEEALDILEGRAPISERPEVESSALALAKRLLDEPEDAPLAGTVPVTQGTVGRHSTNVIELTRRQPWMRMAAALLLGVAVTASLNTGGPERGGTALSAVTSANLVYLEATRSVNLSDVPSVNVGTESWVSLLTYPDCHDADTLHVHVERALTQAQTPATWISVLEQKTGVGSRESLVINVPSALLQPGLHRLRIVSERDGEMTASLNLQFRVDA